MNTELLDYLSGHPLFSGLGAEEIKSLDPLISEECLEKSSDVFLEDERADHFYILKQGSLRASIGGKILATVVPGQIFGEIAVLNRSIRTGSVYALEDSRVIRINGRELFFSNTVPVEIAFRLLREIIKPVTSLYYTNDFFKRTRDIILQGENEKVEFKSTLRFNLHSGKFGREIEHAALKTISAFLNSWGGILVIGVDDEKNISGIAKDQFESDDRALLHLTQMIKERIGEHFLQFIQASVERIGQEQIIRIDVNPSNLPAYLTNNQDEYFYIRTGPSTTDLKTSMIYDYIDHRFYRPKA
jgi:signal-transduction protein with cAMP-binding, CBS, and nucleotidyltransferase domain